MTIAHPVFYSETEYVAFEDGSQERHEYLAGQIYAMAGGSPEHARLAGEVIAALHSALRPGCAVFTSDLRVRIEAANLTTYPDVSVACGNIELAPIDKHAYTNPRLLVEVTSPITENYGRGEKLAAYQSLPSVTEILLVSQTTPWLVLHRRGGTIRDVAKLTEAGTGRDEWTCIEAGPGQSIELESLPAVLNVDSLYHGRLV